MSNENSDQIVKELQERVDELEQDNKKLQNQNSSLDAINKEYQKKITATLLPEDTNLLEENAKIKRKLSILKTVNKDLNKKVKLLEKNINKGGRPSKFDDGELIQIKYMHESGDSYRIIAQKMNCSIGTVSNILSIKKEIL